jgi:hypothetical protein
LVIVGSRVAGDKLKIKDFITWPMLLSWGVFLVALWVFGAEAIWTSIRKIGDIEISKGKD